MSCSTVMTSKRQRGAPLALVPLEKSASQMLRHVFFFFFFFLFFLFSFFESFFLFLFDSSCLFVCLFFFSFLFLFCAAPPLPVGGEGVYRCEFYQVPTVCARTKQVVSLACTPV